MERDRWRETITAHYRRDQRFSIDSERRILCLYREQKKKLLPKTGVEPVSLLFTELIDVCAGRPQQPLISLWSVNVLLTSTYFSSVLATRLLKHLGVSDDATLFII